jgi:hypothetical protein
LLLEHHSMDLRRLACAHAMTTAPLSVLASLERIVIRNRHIADDQRLALAQLLKTITADLSTTCLDSGLIIGLAARPALTRRR